MPLSLTDRIATYRRTSGLPGGTLSELQTLLTQQQVTLLEAVRTSSSIRNNTTTFANDSELFLTFPRIGTWFFEQLFTINAPAATAGAKFRWVYSGTQANLQFLAINDDNTSVSGQRTVAGNTDGEFFISVDTAPITGLMHISGSIRVTTVGTLNFQWAQNVAQVFDTVILTDSYMRATQAID